MIPLTGILPSIAPLPMVDEPAPAPSSAKPLEQHAQQLLADNKVAFPFGSSNQDNNRTSLDQFNFILDKLLELIKNDKLFDGKIKKLKLSKQDQLPLKNARDEVIKELNVLGIKNKEIAGNEAVVRDTWGACCAKKKDFTSIFRLMTLYPGDSIKKLYEKEQGEHWLENWHDHLGSHLASLLLKYSKAILNAAVRINPVALEENNKYCALYGNGVNDNAMDKDKTLFLTYTCQDVLHALPCGHANCGLMADLAFLRAIDSPLTVTYIRFQSPEYEEINAIALGNFPDVGSLIVDPWSNRIFTWQGSVKDTPEVSAYAECKTIFSNAPDEVRNDFLATPAYTEFKEYFSTDAHTKMRSDIANQRAEIEAINQLFQATATNFYKTKA